ncbi:MAG: pseudouridine synthase [Myxococcota bacterium]
MDEPGEIGGPVRLAKLIARRGLTSRRSAEAWIAEGRVVVNGVVADGSVPVDPRQDEVRVDGRPLPPPPPQIVFALYKPRGVITSRDDPDGRKSVFDMLEGIGTRVEAVGRLDFDTEGLLLLTNDGELAHALTHPTRKVPKRYLAKVYRTPDARDLQTIERGVMLEDGRTQPAKARVVETTDTENAWVEITVTEGRNRLIRRMMGALGHPVSKLRRESFGTISLRGMERGQLRQLTGPEVQRLRDVANGKAPSSAGRKRKAGFARPKPKAVKPLHRKSHSRSTPIRAPINSTR